MSMDYHVRHGKGTHRHGPHFSSDSLHKPMSGGDDNLYPVGEGLEYVKQNKQYARENTCRDCCYWHKEYWWNYPGQNTERIEDVHPCNRLPRSERKRSTDWCGEYKGE